jgi:hypothetical protein
MKLKQLLNQITGLPWTYILHADPQQGHIMGRERLVADLQACAAMSHEQAKANLAYITHAANVLPDIVEPAQEVLLNTSPGQYPPPKRSLDKLRAAITKALHLNQRRE